MARQLPTDKTKVPAQLVERQARGGDPNWTYLGPVKGGRTRDAYGVEIIKPGHVVVWRRVKGSWSKAGGSGYNSIAAAQRAIARREGVLND